MAKKKKSSKKADSKNTAKKATTKKTTRKPAKKAESVPQIRTHKDLVNNIANLAAEFTGDHAGAEAVTGGSTLLDSLVNSWIPTGCPNFDAMMQGGFPCGRVSQVFGLESTGKSTYVQSALIQCIRMGGVGILMDPEASFDPDRFRRMGGDPDAVILIQKEYGGKERGKISKKSKTAKDKGLPALTVQDVFRYTYDILDKIAALPQWQGRPVFVGLDSLDNITTDEALNGDPTGMTLKPRLIREGFRHITSPVAKSKACFVIVSQTIENIGSYGSKTTTAGGGGPKFISSVRISTKKFWFGDNDFYTRTGVDRKEFTGNALIQALCIKNKLNRPYMSCVTAINNDSQQYYEGVDPDFCFLYNLAEEIIKTKPGVGYRYLVIQPNSPEVAETARRLGLKIGTEYPFIMTKWREWLEEYPAVREYLSAYVKAKYQRPDMYVPKEAVETEESEETEDAESNPEEDAS